MQLRPYQQQLITDIRLQYQLGHHRVLAVLPTGGGKTVCFSYIAQAAARKGNRVCILVHRAELLDQASRSLMAMGVTHGRIAAGRSMDLSHAVQVASVQTLARRLHKLPAGFFQLLVVDEAHHTNSNTWSTVLQHFQQAHVLGVTATPCRGDGRGLGDHYEVMVQGPSAAWLTDNGYLASARVLAPPGFDSAGLRKRMGDFDTKDAEQRVGTIMGDCVSHYRKHLPGQTAIAFCCSVAHAEAVAALFLSQGIPAASIDGTMTADQRRDLLTALGTGRIKVLTSCSLIGEGVDVPSVGGCILLRPTQSVSLHLQMIGRCLRPSGDKVAVVLDHVGNTLRLGHHLEDRDWTLDGAQKRDREQAPSVKVCPVCFSTSMSAAQVCRDCGHVFAPQETKELKVVDGELVEMRRQQTLKPGDAIEVRAFAVNGKPWIKGWKFEKLYEEEKNHGRAKCYDPSGKGWSVSIDDIRIPKSESIRADRREQGSAQTLDDLRKLAQQRGYKRGWAERVYQARLAKRHGL
jgi:superfamily II DNA or RNA helicase